MMRIGGIAYELPERIVTNEELHRENPQWDIQQIEQRSGVLTRRIAAEGETALDLSLRACQKLFAAHPGLKEKVDGVLYCTQSPDHIMPPNACLLHRELGLPDAVFATDFTLACSGFVYGLALGRGLVASGVCRNILLVTADTYSRYIHPNDRATRVLFGDGAAVTWLCAAPGSDEPGAVLDIECGTYGRDADKFMIPAGGCRVPKSEDTSKVSTDRSGNQRTPENIHMDGMGVLNFVKLKIPKHMAAILQRNGLTLESVDRVIFHQASKTALDSLEQALRLPASKSFRNLAHVGNTVSASIPIALKDALDQGAVRSGEKVLLVSFGVGLSYASALVRV